MRLGASLLVTTGVALAVRVLVPRALGPGEFGALRLVESYADLLLVLLTFGIDSQLRREAATDPGRTLRSFGGLALLRVGLGVLVIGVAMVVLRRSGAASPLALMFLGLGLSQVLVALNNAYAAFEHAAGDVGWLARTNVGMKLCWAGAMVLTLAAWRTGLGVVLAGLVVEAVRCAWLTRRFLRRHGLTLTPDWRLATGIVSASVPLFVNAVAHTFYGRLGIGWLGASSGPVEVGLYGAASNVASLALLGMPILTWVLVPSAARADADGGRLPELVAGTLRICLVGAVPLALACAIAAPEILGLCFGAGYAGAVPMLRALAPTFALAYVSTVCAIELIQRGRAWTMALVSLAGVAAAVPLHGWMIGGGAGAFGVPGGGVGAAAATLATELLVTLVLAGLTWRTWWQPRLARAGGALAAAVTAVLAADAAVPVTGIPAAVAAVGVCGVLLVASGGLTRADLEVVFRAWRSRRPTPAMTPEVA